MKYKKYFPLLLIGLISILINLFLHWVGAFILVETKLYDYRFQLRGPINEFKQNEPDVVIVEIDDESYDRDFKDHCEFIDADQPSARDFRKLFELDPIPIFQLVSMLDRYVIPYKEKRKWE